MGVGQDLCRATPCRSTAGLGLVAALAFVTVAMVSAPAIGQTPVDRDAEAQRVFQAGQAAFDAADYDHALADFQRAYTLSNRPELLYNVGVVADRLRHDAEALDAFERFLASTPLTVEHRADAEARVRVLRAVSAGAMRPTGEAAPTGLFVPTWDDTAGPAPAPAAPPSSATNGPGALPWVVLSIGAAVAIGGVVLVIAGESDRASVENAPRPSAWASFSDAASRAPVLDAVGVTAIILGALGIGAGLVWAFSASGEPRRDVHVALGLGSLMVSGRF